jgi:hypothetical protein
MRAAAILLAGALLMGGEGEPPPAPPLTFRAGAMAMSLAPERPSEASGGVWIGYEAVRLECDRLSYRLAALPGEPRPVLAAADLTGAPGGGGRILFDSTASRLPGMAFRGVLRAARVQIRRLDADPQRPGLALFRAEASDLDDVAGLIETPAGPRAHLAWASRAVLDFAATADPGGGFGLGQPRLTALHLYGAPAADGVPARQAAILRLGKDAALQPGDTVAGRLASGAFGMRAGGMTMSLHFDADGRLSGYSSDSGDYEVRDGEDIVPRLGGSSPQLK